MRGQKEKKSLGKWALLCVLCCLGLFIIQVSLSLPGLVRSARADDVESPDRKFLFFEDRQKKDNKKKRKQQFRQRQARIRAAQNKNLPFDINATNINYDQSSNKVIASGGLIIAYGSSILEAQSGTFDVQTHEADLRGDVRISDLSGNLLADSAQLNLDTGAGTLNDAQIYFEEGGYRVRAKEAKRLAKDEFEFTDAKLSTCACPDCDECRPWELRGTTAKVTRNGYGQVWNGSLAVDGVPVMYVPYLIFPAKTERQTGFLPPSFGNSSRNGFEFELPFFINIDRSTDATLTPIIQTKTRLGIETEYRQLFSSTHKLRFGATYLNESLRDGELRGTDITDLNDPELKEQRFASYLNESWRSPSARFPMQVIVDGNYVSDDLLLREFEQPEIADYNARFVTSRAIARIPLFSTYSAEVSTEYNQAMVDDDNLLFHELPQVDVSGIHVFRPFGENDYGTKLVYQNDLNATYFSRHRSYHGLRAEAIESVKMPFYFQNFFDGSIASDVRASDYELDDNQVEVFRTQPGASDGDYVNNGTLDSSSTRVVPGFTAKLGTTFERVFDVSDNEFWKGVAELGAAGRQRELVRLKHTLEPDLKYRFVPEVNQDDNPQFDGDDRLARRNVVTYGLTQRLYSRFQSRNDYLYGIEEGTPEVKDIPNLSEKGIIDEKFDFGVGSQAAQEFLGIDEGKRAELASLAISQSYDIATDRGSSGTQGGSSLSNSEDAEAFSDVAISARLIPNEYVRLKGTSNVKPDGLGLSSYSLEGQLLDKRGDEVRSRLSFVDGSVRQLESGLELAVTERLKLGYYSRYDDLNKEFIESRLGLRLKSACRCWIFDVEYSNKVNPDQTDVMLNVTLVGLGEFGDRLFRESPREGSSS